MTMTMWWKWHNMDHSAWHMVTKHFNGIWFGKLCSVHGCVHPMDSAFVQMALESNSLSLQVAPTRGRTYFQKES